MMRTCRTTLGTLAALLVVTAFSAAHLGCAFPRPGAGESAKGSRGGSAGGEQALAPPPFQEARALRDLVRITSSGPRVPGAAGHEQARAYMAQILAHHGFIVREDPFTFRDQQRGPVEMSNLIAARGPEEPTGRGAQVLLATHYDTRPVADEEEDRSRRAMPVPGANDGASGVAVLLEVARQVAKDPDRYPPLTLAFVDGEDWPTTWRPSPAGVALAGSRRLAGGLDAGEYAYALVIDMVGDADLRLKPEAHSVESSAGLVDRVWQAGSAIAPEAFRAGPGPRLVDDHLPLIAAGVPTCLVIDFEYAHWHTLADTPEHVSASSLGAVGRTVLATLRRPPPAE